MSTAVTYVGNSYSVPAYQDTGYAQGSGNLSSYLIALATGSLTLSGGTFTLTADANFGATYGLISAYFTSRTASAATAGAVRLANADNIAWRNATNAANLTLTVNASNLLVFSGSLGANTMGANIAGGGFKFTGLGAGSTTGDSVRYEQVLLLAGGTMTGNITFDSATHGTVGASGAAGVTAGNVGETLVANATGVSVSNSATNVTSKALTAGIWLVTGTISNNGAAAANTFVRVGVSANSASFTGCTDGLDSGYVALNGGNGAGSITFALRIAAGATYYLVAQSSNGASTYAGAITALRVA